MAPRQAAPRSGAEGNSWNVAASLWLLSFLLTSSSSSSLFGELNASVRGIAATAFAGFESQATQIGQLQAAITSILADARAFVAQTHTEMQSSKTSMSAEVDALNMKTQDVVKFIEGSNTTAAEVDEQLKVITAWMRDNNFESVPPRMTAAEAKTTELAANFDQRCRDRA